MIIDELRLNHFLDDPNIPQAWNYVDKLKREGNLFTIGNIDIDIKNFVNRTFACDTAKCANLDDCRKKDNSCCTDHGVMVTGQEYSNIMKLLKKYKDDVKEQMYPSFDVNKIFVEDDDYDGMTHTIKKNNVGSCYLSYHAPGNKVMCILEYICRKHKLNPLDFKPVWCFMWPMSFLKYNNDRYLLTVYCEETVAIFDMSEEETDFLCVKDPDKNDPPFYKEEERVLRYIFGDEFYQALERAAEKILAGNKPEKVRK